MTAKEFLRQVFSAYQEVDSKLEQIARLQSLAQRTTTIISGTPHGAGTALSSRVEQAVIAIGDKAEYLADEINHLLKVQQEVTDAINQVTDPTDRRILEYRYLAFKSWKEISHAMKIGLRYVFKLHERALKNFAAVH